LRMERNRGIGKDNARLCKGDFWIGVYLMIHNYKRVGDGEIKNRMGFKNEEI